MAPSHVLVPLDGSPLADEALEYALDVFDCQITVLNVVTPVDARMAEGGVLGIDDVRLDAAQRRASKRIERARRNFPESDRAIDLVVVGGQPAETILETAESRDVDQIVMGSHGGGKNDTLRRLLGTVSTAVLGAATVPVTIIR